MGLHCPVRAKGQEAGAAVVDVLGGLVAGE